MRIVPPAKTVIPSPKSFVASSTEVGTSVSAAMTDSMSSPATRVKTPVALRRYAPSVPFASIDELESALARASYLPDRGLATALYLSLKLEKPLLLEGEAGVGKTEAAKAIARALDTRLIRLQCYEGLDVAHAVY